MEANAFQPERVLLEGEVLRCRNEDGSLTAGEPVTTSAAPPPTSSDTPAIKLRNSVKIPVIAPSEFKSSA